MCEVVSEIHVHVMDDLITIESVSHRRSRMGTPVEFILEFYVRIVAPASRGDALQLLSNLKSRELRLCCGENKHYCARCSNDA
jgi:hypothetical protein